MVRNLLCTAKKMQRLVRLAGIAAAQTSSITQARSDPWPHPKTSTPSPSRSSSRTTMTRSTLLTATRTRTRTASCFWSGSACPPTARIASAGQLCARPRPATQLRCSLSLTSCRLRTRLLIASASFSLPEFIQVSLTVASPWKAS